MKIRQYITAISLCSILAASATLHLTAQEKAAPTAQTQLAKDLIGTWILVGAPGKVKEAPAAGGRIKFFTGKHWMITQPDAETAVTVYHHGGTYTLEGDAYTETIEYANESTKSMIKEVLKFTLKVEGDTLTQTGIGNPYTEVWKRVK